MNPAYGQFRREVRHLFHVSLLNIVFSALAIAFGISYIVLAVNGQDPAIQAPWHRVLTGALSMVLAGLGLSWLLSTTRVFGSVAAIKDHLNSHDSDSDEEQVTCLIIRMLAHYRDNRETIRRMILVCTAGGWVFFVLGITGALEMLTVTRTGGEFTLDAVRLIPSMLLTLGIALSSLLSSHYFRKFSVDWDRRVDEVDGSECTFREILGTERP